MSLGHSSNTSLSSSVDPWLLLKFFISLLLLLSLAPALLPDEAQYWVWSQQLDIGYYSKPPGIAWLIALSCSLFGSSDWSVRLPSLLLSGLAAYFLERGLLAVGLSEQQARRGNRLFAFCPLLLYGSFAATTDVGLITSWCALLYFLAQPSRGWSRFWRLALSSASGMLFKPTILLLIPAQLLRPRSAWRDSGALATGCAAAGALFLLWNAQHDWVTLRHMQQQLLGSKSGAIVWQRPLELLLTQLLLLSPWLAYLGIAQLYRVMIAPSRVSLKAESVCWLRWHAQIVLLSFGLVLLASLRVKYQANWLLFTYPHLFYLIAAAVASFESGRAHWICRLHALIHSLLFLTLVYLSWAQASPDRWLSETPWRWNAFRQAAGWHELPKVLSQLGFDSRRQFLLSDKYQTLSQLCFYTGSTPVYWFNLHGARQNQFSLWNVPPEWQGREGLFLAVESSSLEKMQAQAALYLERLAPHFQQIEGWGVVPFFEHGGRVERTLLWVKLSGYRATRPADPQRY